MHAALGLADQGQALGAVGQAALALVQGVEGGQPEARVVGLIAVGPVGQAQEEVMATLEKLGELKSKGILTQEEFDAKKDELLNKLV